ncbi:MULTISPECIES: hypothetical protein [unclassified Streptomyces]
MLSAAALTVAPASPAEADRAHAEFGQARLTGLAPLPAETFVPTAR